jgi:hypothetical protein
MLEYGDRDIAEGAVAVLIVKIQMTKADLFLRRIEMLNRAVEKIARFCECIGVYNSPLIAHRLG